VTSPRRRRFVAFASVLTLLLFLVGLAIAAFNWRRVRVALLVECLVRGHCDTCRWPNREAQDPIKGGLVDRTLYGPRPSLECGRLCPWRARESLDTLADTEAELLEPYAFDDRPANSGQVGEIIVRCLGSAHLRRVIRDEWKTSR
jgi:hypothetical protein